jgi:hypothetical protein
MVVAVAGVLLFKQERTVAGQNGRLRIPLRADAFTHMTAQCPSLSSRAKAPPPPPPAPARAANAAASPAFGGMIGRKQCPAGCAIDAPCTHCLRHGDTMHAQE